LDPVAPRSTHRPEGPRASLGPDGSSLHSQTRRTAGFAWTRWLRAPPTDPKDRELRLDPMAPRSTHRPEGPRASLGPDGSSLHSQTRRTASLAWTRWLRTPPTNPKDRELCLDPMAPRSTHRPEGPRASLGPDGSVLRPQTRRTASFAWTRWDRQDGSQAPKVWESPGGAGGPVARPSAPKSRLPLRRTGGPVARPPAPKSRLPLRRTNGPVARPPTPKSRLPPRRTAGRRRDVRLRRAGCRATEPVWAGGVAPTPKGGRGCDRWLAGCSWESPPLTVGEPRIANSVLERRGARGPSRRRRGRGFRTAETARNRPPKGPLSRPSVLAAEAAATAGLARSGHRVGRSRRAALPEGCAFRRSRLGSSIGDVLPRLRPKPRPGVWDALLSFSSPSALRTAESHLVAGLPPPPRCPLRFSQPLEALLPPRRSGFVSPR
jgi:hypothetical protein